jgi:hypothetical protein
MTGLQSHYINHIPHSKLAFSHGAVQMSSLSPPSLNTVPIEVLEHIALFAATETFLGPPSAIPSLLATCRTISSTVSVASNSPLYARIFAWKFDIAPAARRLFSERTAAHELSSELQRRCTVLKRIRHRLDATIPLDVQAWNQGGDSLRTVLWTAYLMMLENDGKNEEQLRSYAGIRQWLSLFWFDDRGASFARCAVRMDCWPEADERNALAMWLFWFLLRTGASEFSHFRDVIHPDAGFLLLLLSQGIIQSKPKHSGMQRVC